MKVAARHVIVLILLTTCVSATINPSKNKKGKQKISDVNVKVNKGPQEKSVYDKNLVDIEPLASEIIAEAHTYYRETYIKNFNGSLLGYVTPVIFLMILSISIEN